MNDRAVVAYTDIKVEVDPETGEEFESVVSYDEDGNIIEESIA